MSEQARGIWPRIGISALNLLAPGLGLMRLGRLRLAVALLLAYPILLLAVATALASNPRLELTAFLSIVGMAALLQLAIYGTAVILSWSRSRNRHGEPPWWTRWYGLAGAWLLWLAAMLAAPDLRSYYRTFYIPSLAMAPTLLPDDRVVASMQPGPVRRGDVILLKIGNHIYIKRVAALAGDRIAMEDGVVVLNGEPVPQRLVRLEPCLSHLPCETARRMVERFPGEAAPHEIYDSGPSAGDDFPEQRIASGHVFVLGDNRDDSADSRYPRDEHGVAQLPVSDIVGRALYYLWGPSGRFGEPIHRSSD